MSEPLSFPSRVDWWLVAIPLIAVASTLAVALRLRNVAPNASLLAFAGAAFVVLLSCLIAVPCRYVLEAEHLLIRSGVLRQRIRYRDITGLALSSSAMSAPALSLRRVKVSYGQTSRLVSPRDREWFIQAVRERITQAHQALPHNDEVRP